MQESRIETSGDETKKDTKNIQKTTIRHDNRPKWMKKGQENKVKNQKKKTYEKAVKAHYQYSEIRYRNDSGLGNNNSKKDKKQPKKKKYDFESNSEKTVSMQGTVSTSHYASSSKKSRNYEAEQKKLDEHWPVPKKSSKNRRNRT